MPCGHKYRAVGNSEKRLPKLGLESYGWSSMMGEINHQEKVIWRGCPEQKVEAVHTKTWRSEGVSLWALTWLTEYHNRLAQNSSSDYSLTARCWWVRPSEGFRRNPTCSGDFPDPWHSCACSCITPVSASVCPWLFPSLLISVFSFCEDISHWSRAHPHPLWHYFNLTNFICKDPCSKKRSHSEVLGRHGFWGDTIQPRTVGDNQGEWTWKNENRTGIRQQKD